MRSIYCRYPLNLSFLTFIDVICTFKAVTAGLKPLPIVRAVGGGPRLRLGFEPGPTVVSSIAEELVLSSKPKPQRMSRAWCWRKPDDLHHEPQGSPAHCRVGDPS